jgi:predicted RNA-binding Zn-ribbon protein involved in translation (DUF1610 family)
MGLKFQVPRERNNPNALEEISCPHCGEEVEMWSRDAEMTCPKCAKLITRDK